MWQGIKNVYHLGVAFLANVWYGFPSKKLTVIGVTGTDGKTTTVSLIYHILKTAGKEVSMISSVGAVIGGKASDIGVHVTTPSPFALQAFVKKASEEADYLILEVTSHAIDQYRIWGIDFALAVLTNVTSEHLDYHKTYENYVQVKAKFLKKAKIAVINKDDASYALVSQILKGKNYITYGREDSIFKTKLVGEFNHYNIQAAFVACKAIGLSDKDIKLAIASFEPPLGRQEVIYNSAYKVMIDFAHTPNALEQVLKTVRPTCKRKLIHVFGSAGERDYQKRPKMGEISAKYADVIILTAEDPRGESVEKISEEIALGIKDKGSRIKNRRLLKIPDRQEAITQAIRMVRKGDLILLTGKGHEKSMNYGRGEEPWSEHEAVARALKNEKL